MKKIRVEIEEEGDKSCIEVASNKDLSEIYKLIGLFIEELKAPSSSLNGASSSAIYKDQEVPRFKLSLVDRFKSFVVFEFSDMWFTSKEVKEKFDRDYKDNIKMSTVSTYLSRMFKEKILERKGDRNNREYRVILDKGKNNLVAKDTFLSAEEESFMNYEKPCSKDK